MAYNDYGAFVWKNGERIKDNEDAVPSRLGGGGAGLAIYGHLLETYPDLVTGGASTGAAADGGAAANDAGDDAAVDCPEAGGLYHAVLGDGDWRLGVYKTGLPYLFRRVDGHWTLLDLLAYADPHLLCRNGDAGEVDCGRVHVPDEHSDNYFGWVYELPGRRLEASVPDGPTIILEPGRHHARWHWETIHVSMTVDGDCWEAECGSGYGAGFEGSAENRARNVRMVVDYCKQVGSVRWRKLSPCPECGRKPTVADLGYDLWGARRVAAACKRCGITTSLKILSVDVLGLNQWKLRGRDAMELRLAKWAMANRLQLLESEWNKLANDSKLVHRLRRLAVDGARARRCYQLTLDDLPVVDVEMRCD